MVRWRAVGSKTNLDYIRDKKLVESDAFPPKRIKLGMPEMYRSVLSRRHRTDGSSL